MEKIIRLQKIVNCPEIEIYANNTVNTILNAIMFIISDQRYTMDETKIIEEIMYNNKLGEVLENTLQEIKTELELRGKDTSNIEI